eukprot:1150355-Pelagomonas_calceolata.AAC.1
MPSHGFVASCASPPARTRWRMRALLQVAAMLQAPSMPSCGFVASCASPPARTRWKARVLLQVAALLRVVPVHLQGADDVRVSAAAGDPCGAAARSANPSARGNDNAFTLYCTVHTQHRAKWEQSALSDLAIKNQNQCFEDNKLAVKRFDRRPFATAIHSDP